MGDNAPCSDGGIVANRNIGQDDSTSSYPYIAADGYWCSDRFPKMAVFGETFRGVRRMSYGVYLYVWTDAAIITDSNFIAIQEDAIHVDFHIVAEEYVFSVVNEYRCRYPYILASTAQ